MIHTISEPKKTEQVIDHAMAAAMKAFNKNHGSTHDAVAQAINAYINHKRSDMVSGQHGLLTVDLADSELGPNSAVVITGFENPSEAIAMIGRMCEKR